jgi:dihydrofolate reductase
VITHNKSNSNKQIIFTDVNPIDLLEKLKQQDGKDIWICGGANLVQQIMRADLIDRYYISIIPTLLGKGIKLFG